MSRFSVLTMLLCLIAVISNAELSAPALEDLPLQDSISIDGITWRFTQDVSVGRFVNGHYYVVGSVTIASISPEPADSMNGSVLNLPVDQGISGFDYRVSSNRFREALRAYPPITMDPGDALISSISVEQMGELKAWLRESDDAISPVRSVSILTCLAEPVATDAFRPSYCGRLQKIFHASGLNRGLLANYPKVDGIPDIGEWADHFRRPWLDVCFFGFDAAVEYQPHYGREVGRAVGIATLLLSCDFTPEEKEPLLINFIQYGIDLWGIVEAGYPGWQAHGGHGSGRKWPIIFTGLLLDDTQMQSPETKYPELRFGEDMQTMYDDGWTGAKVVYAGHQGVIDSVAVSNQPGWGPYEHLPPSDWYDNLGEDYRRCCTSLSWVGQALSAKIMQAEALWNHNAFFDYVDRWMTEGDSAAVEIINQTRGWDYSAEWARQGQCWDEFVENMWAEYRNTLSITSQPEFPERRSFPVLMNKDQLLRLPPGAKFYNLTGKSLSTDHIEPGGIYFLKSKDGKYISKIILIK